MRGSGRGYGDLALNNGHVVLDMSSMNRILEFVDNPEPAEPVWSAD